MLLTFHPIQLENRKIYFGYFFLVIKMRITLRLLTEIASKKNLQKLL